jgi:two-component sensor histidine kinase
VKNNLAAVISLAEQTGRGSTEYGEFLDKFMGRLRAMSRMHSVLAQSRWQGADLRTLVMQTLEAFGSGSVGKSSVRGESVLLGPRAAQAMAMALNELATNAVKYGALSSPGGTVGVSWGVRMEDGVRRLGVRWEERGGPEVRAPERRGFGSQLIEGTISYELRGTVTTEYARTGVVCSMDVPLTEEIGPMPEEPDSGNGVSI